MKRIYKPPRLIYFKDFILAKRLYNNLSLLPCKKRVKDC